jgi:hypothetical protein
VVQQPKVLVATGTQPLPTPRSLTEPTEVFRLCVKSECSCVNACSRLACLIGQEALLCLLKRMRTGVSITSLSQKQADRDVNQVPASVYWSKGSLCCKQHKLTNRHRTASCRRLQSLTHAMTESMTLQAMLRARAGCTQ